MSHFLRSILPPAAVFVGSVLLAVTSHATDLYVDPAGTNGAYRTVQAAIDAAPAGTPANRTNIHIKPGRYTEKITVPRTKPFLCLLGQATDPAQCVLTFALSAKSPNGRGGTVGTTGSSSTVIAATDFVAKNITFQNSTRDNVAQAVAIKTTADRIAFENCRFWGFQDTLYVTGGRQYLKNCTVTGDTDFIFGNATAVLDHCTINESGPAGFYTAANTRPTTAIGLVFLSCTLTGNPNTDVDPTSGARYSSVAAVTGNATPLGRPWQYRTSKASVTYLRCKMAPCVTAAGWSPWDSGNTNPGSTTRYSEYASMDLRGHALDISRRVPWSHQLTTKQAGQYTLAHIFGPARFWGSTYADWGTYVAWDPVATLNDTPRR